MAFLIELTIAGDRTRDRVDYFLVEAGGEAEAAELVRMEIYGRAECVHIRSMGEASPAASQYFELEDGDIVELQPRNIRAPERVN